MNQEQLTWQKIKKREVYIDASYQSIGYLIFERWNQGTIKIEDDEEILQKLNEQIQDIKDLQEIIGEERLK